MKKPYKTLKRKTPTFQKDDDIDPLTSEKVCFR